MKKKQSKIKIVVIDLLILVIFYFCIYFVTKFVDLTTFIGKLIQNGYDHIFLGGDFLAYFLSALFVFFIIIIWVIIIYFLFILLNVKKDPRKKAILIFSKAIKESIIKLEKGLKEKKNVFLVIITIGLSITVMMSGIIFLINAFPAENFYHENGLGGKYHSKIKCESQVFKNIISGHDQSCRITLSEFFDNKTRDYAKVVYYKNRDKFEENVSWDKTDQIFLYFNKEIQPQFLILRFKGGDQEIFTINNKGIYTKHEYYEREKEKAAWFFGIISFSFFSIFSAMANLKQILGW